LTLDEIHEGLTTIMGHVKGNLKEFEDLMISLDKNCNGVIDYSEFLTAAVSKTKLLTTDNLKTAF
jgi:Ca2+-binding EF-hand superfamily protein